MNRNGRCWPLRPSRSSPMLLLLLILLFVGIAVCEEEQKTAISNKVDQDVAGVRSFFDYIFGSSETPEGQSGKALRAGRTFGHKRIQFMLMPMVYKMGVMMTMLTVLTVISVKGLMIGLMLLVLKLSAIFGKLYASWGHHQSYGHASWTPPQPVHVHVHNSGGGSSYGPHGQAYGGWETAASGPPDEHYYYKG